MTEGEKKRVYLDWWKHNGDVVDMAGSFPECGCESADSSAYGFGPIVDEERLRYFAVTRSDIDMKRSRNKQITSSIFKRCFKSGVSTCRLAYASREELNLSAKILHEFQVRENGEFGGVMGVVDFLASAVRRPNADAGQVCCVFDTPLDGRNAHADILSSKVINDPEIQTSLRLALFNSIGGTRAFTPASEVTDCDLQQFVPAVMQGQPEPHV